MDAGLGIPKYNFPSFNTVEILVSNIEILEEGWRLGAAVGEEELAVRETIGGSQAPSRALLCLLRHRMHCTHAGTLASGRNQAPSRRCQPRPRPTRYPARRGPGRRSTWASPQRTAASVLPSTSPQPSRVPPCRLAGHVRPPVPDACLASSRERGA
jgi:hypothetical protein